MSVLGQRSVPAWRCGGAMRPGLVALLLASAAMLNGCGNLPTADRDNTPLAADRSEDEQRARVRLELATAYFSNRSFSTALEEVRRALQIYPELPQAYGLRGLIYAAMGDEQLAEQSFRQGLAMKAKDAALLHNMAWFECQRRRFDEAERLFEQALIQPQYREVARTQAARGVCLARAGKPEEAEAALMRAFELEPANTGTGFNLAEVLYRRGAYERARFYINRVNDAPEATNAQTLWLAIRIERKLGRESMVRVLGNQLTTRFPQSPEATLFDRGRFDD